MELIELKGTARDGRGKGNSRALRREGMLPAVLYGYNIDAVRLSVSGKDIETAVKAGSTAQLVFNLSVDGAYSGARPVMIKELQRHPVTGDFLHIDFYAIQMDKKVKVPVPVETTGICKGVELGGILQIIRRELEVESLPDDIPDSIVVDISDLDVGDSLHIEDMPLEGDLRITGEPHLTVITVLSPVKEKEEEEEEDGEETEEETEETEKTDE